MATTLPPKLAHLVTLWAHNPMGMPKPIQEDEFGHLDLGNLDVWPRAIQWPQTPHKGTFIHATWDIFLTPGRWVDLVGDNGWALPVADDLHNKILARWAWQEGSTPDSVNPQYLAQWLGHNMGITPDWTCNLLKPYASCHAQDIHFSYMAREAHKNLIKRSRKTVLVTATAPRASASTVEQGSIASTLSGSLTARLSTTAPTTLGSLATRLSHTGYCRC